MLKCKFCNKEFKTTSGYERHMCEKKNRYVNFNHTAFLYYNDFLIWSHTKKSKNPEEQKMGFIKSSFYKDFVKLSDWLSEINAFSPHLYIQWVVKNNVSIKDWIKSRTYHSFLFEYLKLENDDEAIFRSQQFLDNKNETLETIAPYDLYMALYYGHISFKYIKKKNFDYKNKIDIVVTKEELNQLEFFLESLL